MSDGTQLLSRVSWRLLAIVQWTVWALTVRLPLAAGRIVAYSGIISSVAFTTRTILKARRLKLTFPRLVILAILLTFALSTWIKLRFLNRYTKLKEEALPKAEGFDLNPDVAKEQGPGGISSWLDDFLSAIRVFGFLDRSTFHELGRHLQTRRLMAGDTINLTEDPSFYIVVEGSVQVFAQTKSSERQRLEAYDDEDDNGWQLLNVVNAGGTLSSLFTILRLFTESIQLRFTSPSAPPTPTSQPLRPDDDVAPLMLDAARRRPRKGSKSSHLRHSSNYDSDSTEGTAMAEDGSDDESSGSRPGLRNGRGSRRPRASSRPSPPSQTHDASDEPQIARALTDTTLAVLPAEAFRRLTSRHTRASSHIVQVILARLHRVTFMTADKHLGLTKEVVRTEKAVNDLACYPLPPSFYESGGMSRLRQRFVPDTSRPSEKVQADWDYFTYDPPSPTYGPELGRAASIGKASEPSEGIRLRLQSKPNTPAIGSSSADVHRSRTRLSSGLGMTPASESAESTVFDSPISETASLPDEDSPDRARPPAEARTFSFVHGHDSDLRDMLMDCISRSIGLVQPEQRSAGPSVDVSPSFGPVGGHTSLNGASTPLGQRAALNSSFGPFSLLGSVDDSESITTASSSAHAVPDLQNEVEILSFSRGATLVRAGERNAGLFFVIDGHLDVFMPADREPPAAAKPATPTSSTLDPRNGAAPTRKPLFSIKPGGIAGYLSSLTGFASYVDIVAKGDVFVGWLSSAALERIMDRRPNVLLTLAKRLMGLLSPLILHIDSALEWQHVEAGEVIYRESHVSDSYYIVVQGRLRAIKEKASGGVEILSEYGQGDSVGEVECITGSARSATVHAIRDSELVRMPMALYNAIAIRHPAITIQMTRAIANRVREDVSAGKSRTAASGGGATGKGSTATIEAVRNSNLNLKTIAIVPVSHQVPITDFAERLRHSLEDIGAPTAYLNQATVVGVMGRHAFSRMGKLKLAGWLAETEQKYRIVLYVADAPVSAPWTSTCIRQADCVLMVAHASGDVELGEYERLMMGIKTTARKELILLHPDRFIPSGLTRHWLKLRPFVQAHHHMVLETVPNMVAARSSSSVWKDPAPVIKLKELRQKVVTRLDRIRPQPGRAKMAQQSAMPLRSDFPRLARRLCGRSVGLVLGGGGARGLSHVGAIRAIRERGIPIDQIGGCSIGAFVGGLYAREGDLVSTYGRAKRFSGRMSSLWRILSDVTWPYIAYTTGHEFNRGIFKSFADVHIEDFALPFACNTTNVTWSRMEVHTTGYAWRYIRASMSLAGLLPPLSDNGHLLCDGGYVDNIPCDMVFAGGASSVIALDVGSVDDTSPVEFGESLSGWYIMIARWWPWSAARKIPSMTEIQARLAYISSVPALEATKNTPGVLYLRMPVTQFGTMDFGKFVEIEELGYRTMQKQLDEWDRKGMLPSASIKPRSSHDTADASVLGGRRIRRASI